MIQMQNDEIFEQVQQLEQAINTWNNRARMAHQQGSKTLVRSALKEKLKFKKLLMDLRGHMDDHPNTARVPLRKPPSAGAGEVALPLPKRKTTE